ncbi:N-acetyltransferase 9-like protein [Diaphorina citri]|uniref:N-acetyltransferase 9-like protein n=1 Tax=Diaphorina citri TaxID=121845 RepID=A0A1S3DK82_DIACI|nr:N-acetyltransferase 9-like protein [Diaphorina citri]
MQSEELQSLTASEPLSLEEEYEMQQSWANDEDKCTFIVLDKHKFYLTRDEVESMIGDVNLFLDSGNVGEINVMIAEKHAQGKGLGKETVVQMIEYGCEVLKIEKIIAKISSSNRRSIGLFEKLGFIKESDNSVFQEITMGKNAQNEWLRWLRSEKTKQKTNSMSSVDRYSDE